MDLRSTLDRLIQQRAIVERELVKLQQQQQQTADSSDVDPSEQCSVGSDKVMSVVTIATVLVRFDSIISVFIMCT